MDLFDITYLITIDILIIDRIRTDIPSRDSLDKSPGSPCRNSPGNHDRDSLGIWRGVRESPGIYEGVNGSPRGIYRGVPGDLIGTPQESTMRLTTTLNDRIWCFIIIFTLVKFHYKNSPQSPQGLTTGNPRGVKGSRGLPRDSSRESRLGFR